MTDWTDTARRFAAHPRFPKWESLCGLPVLCDGLEIVIGVDRGSLATIRDTLAKDREVIPVLTSWLWVGVLLGMVAPLAGKDFGVQWWTTQKWIAWNGDNSKRRYEYPGQALAELLLELWGEK